MAQIDVLRPVSTRKNGKSIVVPSGTRHGVTSDNSDLTYLSIPVTGTGEYSLRVASHTPPANHERHRIRGRLRGRCDAGTVADFIILGRGETDSIQEDEAFVGSLSWGDRTSFWYQDGAFGLATVGALADLNIGGGDIHDASVATVFRTAELYVDIDCRERPDYTPDVLDASGMSQDGGTVTDTDSPTLEFGSIDYDGLPELSWSVTVGDFEDSGSGAPPSSVVADALPNGSYTAVFVVSSTIRGADVFEHVEEISFDVDFNPVLPDPPDASLEHVEDGIQLDWTSPTVTGGIPWDDNFVIMEIQRSDCGGPYVRIATISDAITGTYLDRAVPTLDATGGGGNNGCSPPECVIAYRLRYWGVVSEDLVVPQVLSSEWAELTTTPFEVDVGMDRLVGDDTTVTVCTSRALGRPRRSSVSVALAGGLPSVATVAPGQDTRLGISVVGYDNLRALEGVLSDALIYHAPYGGTPGWYAPAGWSVQPETPRTWRLAVSMTEQAAPETDDPEDLL